jgi:hypothetical protein
VCFLYEPRRFPLQNSSQEQNRTFGLLPTMDNVIFYQPPSASTSSGTECGSCNGREDKPKAKRLRAWCLCFWVENLFRSGLVEYGHLNRDFEFGFVVGVNRGY